MPVLECRGREVRGPGNGPEFLYLYRAIQRCRMRRVDDFPPVGHGGLFQPVVRLHRHGLVDAAQQGKVMGGVSIGRGLRQG